MHYAISIFSQSVITLRFFIMPSFPKILVASHNPGKISEISSLLDSVGIEPILPDKLLINEPDECGSSFQENSLIKAKHYALSANIPAISDDSGLCVGALQGAPGIYSARFALDEKTQKTNFPLAFEKIFYQLQEIGIKNEAPEAYFICSLSFFDPLSDFSISFEGRVDGNLIRKPKGIQGFGYDPIFVKSGMVQTFGEISPSKKEKISHRAIAFTKFVKWIRS